MTKSNSLKRALVCGIAGQDGSYLGELLLSKNYEVVGLLSKEGGSGLSNIEHYKDKVTLVSGDIADGNFLREILSKYLPDEIYNFASFSSVADPWKDTLRNVEVTALAPITLLEIIRETAPRAKFFQASSAEMFGYPKKSPQNEDTPFCPVSPYGCAKVFVHQMLGNYRKKYGIFAVSGILFNHESPRRKLEFVTRKIVNTLTKIKMGQEQELVVGNIDAVRDWSFAGDVVEGAWLSLQAEKADDYVFSSGETHTVRELIELASNELGLKIAWHGQGLEEVGKDKDGKIIVRISSDFYRPVETVVRCGDPSKAKELLGWEPKATFKELIQMMVKEEMRN